jgi:choline dehydrogenase-like flavoprotein
MRSTAESYDYVVVGGGTAGSVVAGRLAHEDSARVLLLEAGSAEKTAAMAAPPAWPALLQTPPNWGDTTVPQAAGGATVTPARGRVLGGGSAINAMTFARGHRSGYDAWAADGAEERGFDDLLPYVRRSENAPGRDPAVRGVGGPLTVGPAHPPHPVVAALLRAATGEVVLTAGAIGTRQLLMLCGVGPPAHLSDMGIDTVLDLPGVGANLHDHPIAYVVCSAARPVDGELRVHGLSGLRVADASVLPFILSANTVAERAAELLRLQGRLGRAPDTSS